MNALARAKPLPIYLQISELLTRQIRAGHWREGERLPTEAELAASLGVAVGTLRKSLSLLQEQQVLERIQGSGTYVRGSQAGKSIYEFFRLELHDGPGLPTAKILSVELAARGRSVPVLGHTAHPSAWRVRRLRMLNSTPVALEEIWFDARHHNKLKAKNLGDSMYLFYQNAFNVWISRVEDHISAAAVPAWGVKAFGIDSGQTSGFIERQSWTASGELAEYSQTWFDQRVCRYSSRLST
jgi:GntR family transcriptional regulator